jgi:hypothetical protein
MFISSLVFPNELRLEAFGLGCLLAVLITLFHVTGLGQIVSLFGRQSETLRARVGPPLLASCYLGTTVLLMLLLHVCDTCIWAFVLHGMKLIPDIHDAFYFSANTYTSLGYGDVPLSRDWRELSPLMAISGLFTFACTTSQLFNVMGGHHETVAELRSKHKNSAAD